MENGPFIVDLNIRMVIFHSYITRGSKKTCYAYPPAIEHSNSTCPTNGGLSLFFDGSSIAMFDDRVLYPFFDSEIHWWRYINNVADVETFNRNWLKGTCAMCRKLVHLEVKTCGYGSNFGTPEIDGQEISYQRPNLEVPCTQNLKSPAPWVFTQTHVKSAFSQFMNWSQDPCLVLGADWSWQNGLQLSCHPFTQFGRYTSRFAEHLLYQSPRIHLQHQY